MRVHLPLVVAAALGLAGSAPAEEPASFEVMVLRGAGVARVTGDASGALREETLREDPRPARPEPPPVRTEPAGETISIVVNVAPASGGFLASPGFFLPERFHPGRRVPRGGPVRHVFVGERSLPHAYHGRARAHGRGGPPGGTGR